MKLHLNLSLRRALLAAIAAVSTVSGISQAGVVDPRYDLQYYLDFCYNKGMFSAGATNIEVFFKDGTSIEDINSYADNNIALMPNMDSYGDTLSGLLIGNKIASNGGTNLVSSQFAYGAKHVHEKVGNTPVAFLAENGVANIIYDSANLDYFGKDSSLQRLTKLVTAVAYTPMATDEFMSSIKVNETHIFRIGGGGKWCDGKAIATGDNPLGGVVNLSVCRYDSSTGEWSLQGWARSAGQADDILTPLDIGTYFGDSGSPCFAWDDANNQFVFVGANWAGGCQLSFPNWYLPQYNYRQGVAVIDKYTIGASFSGADIIEWSASDSASGKGTLTQGTATVVEYTGKGTGNTLADSLGLTFSTEDTSVERELQLQGNVNMGAGALTFESGKWKLTELADNNFTLSSAGFEIKKGAELTWELTGSSSQEIRKVGEGTLTIAGSGNNESTLVVGGGSTVYNVTRDAEGNITGCTLGNAGETRLNRTGGYAASSVRLEGGVAIIVLMGDAKDAGGQFKTNSVAGDTFSFGNDGGLLNLNGHDLSWGVINQQGSGKGARIGNLTPLNADKPANSTFTYTGTGTFAGSFMDEGADGALLAVKYNSAGNTWALTGNSTNAGGFTVQAGTMVLEGTKTPHVMKTDAHDWTYASMDTSSVTVKSGAAFQLSHHALLKGDVNVEAGGSFVLNQSANAASESISGGLRQDMEKLGITSLIGNVTLKGAATMTVDANSPVTTTMKGDIVTKSASSGSTSTIPGPPSFEAPAATFVKKGNGTFVLDGNVGYVNGSVEAGGLVVTGTLDFDAGYNTIWTIGEKGFLAVKGTTAEKVANYLKTSTGVLALTSNQSTAIDLTYNTSLYIGAYGDSPIEYGTTTTSLATTYDAATERSVWRLGGGTGTLNVLFQLTGDADLIIGNEYSSGTVHLANTANDFTGDIYIKGTGNMLTYAEGALGEAKVALTYGNTLGLHDAGQLSILKDGAQGVLAFTHSMELDLSGKALSIGATGDVTLTDKVTVSDDTYRFGGNGNLTIDTELTGASKMELDGQGNSGSSVTFAKEDAFNGTIVAGGGLHLDAANSAGDIGIHAGHAESFANLAAMELQQGATLYTDGQSLTVNNLTAGSGSSIRNNGETASLLQLHVDSDKETTIADGVLTNAANTASLGLVKTGDGTLNMGGNTSWSGGLTIMDGTVKGSIANGGIGAAGASIYVQKGATLQLTSGATNNCKQFGTTLLQQKLSGDGAVSISNGNDMLFLNQASGLFMGQVNVTGNTRLYITKDAALDSSTKVSTSQAFDKATIVVEAGSQARVTPSIFSLSTTAVNSWADYVISGSDFKGDSSGLVQSKDDGALLIDCLATVWGNVTLADDATVSSWSHNPTTSQYFWGSNPYFCGPASNDYGYHYGVINRLGGIIRGQILGEGKTLTIGGNESMTITADSRNTFKDLVIANGNGSNDDKFALRLDGGSAVSQTSTALGTGKVTLGDGLILRLAGTGSANNTKVVYTYANNIAAGENATLQSYNITNRLTGTVSMSGSALSLSTANGGVLELAGGIDGTGTLHVKAGSQVKLGSGTSTLTATRNTPVTFNGTVEAEAGADITLASPAAVSAGTSFSGIDNLTLQLAGTDDYTLESITVTPTGGDADLTLSFDFSHPVEAHNKDTWATLTTTNGINADNVAISLELNMFEIINRGEYVLVEGVGAENYDMVSGADSRFTLRKEGDSLILTVAADGRLVWSSDRGTTQIWDVTSSNWSSEQHVGRTTFTNGDDVILSSEGVAANNSADSREVIRLGHNISAGNVLAAGSYYEITGEHALNGTCLLVGEQADLKLSTTSATFTNGVTVDDATLTVEGTALNANISATNGAEVTLESASVTGNINTASSVLSITDSSLNGNIALAGTTSTLKDLTLTGEITPAEGGRIITLSNSNASSGYTASKISYESGEDGTSLTLTDGGLTLDGAIRLDAVNVAADKTITVWNSTATAGADKHLGTVTLDEGAVFQSNDRYEVTESTCINTLQLNGTAATVQDVHHSGAYKISTLSLGEGVTSATLTLKKNAASSWSTIFELGDGTSPDGNFAGTIVLDERHNGTKRSAFIILSGAGIAKDAVISLADAQSSDAHVGLGINTANATIAGLNSHEQDGSQAKLFSGTIGLKKAWNTGDTAAPDTVGDTVRTLTIDTNSRTNASFYGEVLNKLNLVKTGAGTQNFYGASARFDGNIEVEQGTLAVSGAATGMLESAASVRLRGGTLKSTSEELANFEVKFAGDKSCLDVENASVQVAYESGSGSRILQRSKVQVNLQNVKDTTVVSLSDTADDSLNGSMKGGALIFAEGRENIMTSLAIDGTTVLVNCDETAIPEILKQTGKDYYTLANLGFVNGSTAGVHIGTYDADSELFALSPVYAKYFSNLRLNNGEVQADRNTSYYSDLLRGETENGKAGLKLADAALLKLNPQADQSSSLGKVLTALETTPDSGAADELGAALAGAGSAVLSMAVSGDVDRQLKAIRNRTTTMGVDQDMVNEDMPYFNAWINAEGDMSELSENGTEGGYKLNSWGGTVGFDVDLCPSLTAGMAFTAMYGDLDVTGADTATGDLNTYYVSAFARYCDSAWTHTFVATAGKADLSLTRTLMGMETEAEIDGMSFGLMYEVGRVFALNEDGSTCLQPVFNVTWKHTTLDSYTEDGGDHALTVDEQTVDTVTLGLGARLQAVVGESMYNRTSIFEARVLAKADVGDRNGSADVALAALENDKQKVESAEMGAFGLEAGAGLSIPLGEESGSIFMDASVELRSDYTNVNGTVGYRLNF